MATRKSKDEPKWTNVKAKLADFDRKALLELVHGLYNLNKDNKTFLHTRFGLGGDVLEPYKETISRWMSPDPFRNQDSSVAKAKQAISNYKKAVGDLAGLAELMVFFCEEGVDFAAEYGLDDEDYYDALCRMFEQAVATALPLPAKGRDAMFSRLEDVCNTAQNFGYGVEDYMRDLLIQYEP